MPDTKPAPTKEEAQAPVAPPAPKDQKSFDLAHNDSQFLVMVRQQLDAMFSLALSHIAVSRLGYNVSPNTQFVLNAEMNHLKIGELEPKEGGELTTETAPPEPEDIGSGAVASGGGQVA